MESNLEEGTLSCGECSEFGSKEFCVTINHDTNMGQLLVQKGLEWKGTAPMYIFRADVDSAFDELSLEAVLEW